MNKIQIHRPRKPTPYEVDYAQWSAEQGKALREGRFADLDRENLAEEIESLGRSDKREIKNRLNTLLVHLLKWEFQPQKRKGGWSSTIREQRRQIRSLIDESPSLRDLPESSLNSEYKEARLKAADEAKLRLAILPATSPYSIELILDEDFYPGVPRHAKTAVDE